MFQCYICKNKFKEKIKQPRDFEYFFKRKAKYLYCSNCRTLTQFPLPSNKQIKKFYTNDYQNYVGSNFLFLKIISKIFFYLKYLNLKQKYKKNILDYGCGSGEILNNFYINGYKSIVGIDYFRSVNLNKKISFYKNLNSEKKNYDLIILNHVIEHDRNPASLLRKLKKKLSKNGVIIGSTPNSEDFFFKIFGRYWGCLHFPYHINIFSKKSLQVLCSKQNLAVDFYFDFQGTGISQSLENIIKYIFKIKKKGRLVFYPFFIFIGLICNVISFVITRNTSILKFKIYIKH